jgi:hypothetical protein
MSRRDIELNHKISVYWFWLVIIAGFSANAPLVPDVNHSRVSIANVFCETYTDDPLWFPKKGTEKWLIYHALASTLLAIAATLLPRILAKHNSFYRPEKFSLASLFVVTFFLACIFSCLTFTQANYAIYCSVLIFTAGRYVLLYLSAFWPEP